MTNSELDKAIKEENINGIYLFYGENTFMIDTYIKKIKKSFTELLPGINYISIDENNIENLISDIATPAFGYDKKLILVKNSNLFKKEAKTKKTKLSEIQEKIEEYIKENIEEIKNSIVLIFIEENADKNELYKTVETIGNVCNFESLKGYELVKKLKSISSAYGVNVEENTLKYFIELVGTDMQENINELRKLIEYTGKDGTITKEDIDKLTIRKIDAVIFDLTDSLGNKNINRAINVLKDLLYNKEPIQRILIMLYNHFKKLYVIKLAEKYEKDVAQSLNLKPNQAFLLSKYKKQANCFSEENLRVLLKELTSLDANYKVGKIDLNIGLESILCTYCS